VFSEDELDDKCWLRFEDESLVGWFAFFRFKTGTEFIAVPVFTEHELSKSSSFFVFVEPVLGLPIELVDILEGKVAVLFFCCIFSSYV
jgi:hypothetical protein